MDRTSFWVFAGLVTMFGVPAVALAVLERLRGLRATSFPDGTVRPARALGAVEMAGGALIALVAAIGGLWWAIPPGVGIAGLGAASFKARRRPRQWLEWAGFTLLLVGIVLAGLT